MVSEAAVRQGVAQGWVPWSTGEIYFRLRDEARARLGRGPEPYDVLEQALRALLKTTAYDVGLWEMEIARWFAFSTISGAASGSPEREGLRSELERLLQEQELCGDDRSRQRMARIRLVLAQEAVLDAMPRVPQSLRARLPELYAQLDSARQGERSPSAMRSIARIAQAMVAILAAQPPAD